MVPAQYIGASEPTGLGTTTVAFTIPSGAKAGDTMIVIVATSSRSTAVGLAAYSDIYGLIRAGVAETSPAGSSNGQIFVATRTITGTETAALPLVFTAAPANARGVALLYRGVTATLVDKQVADVAASTSFAIPASTAIRYSDQWIGITYASSAAVTFTPALSTTERYDAIVGATGLAVDDRLWDSAGAISGKLASSSAAATGIAAVLLFQAEGLRGAGKVLRTGTNAIIGMPTKGV